MRPDELETVADELPVAIWMGSVPSGDVVYTNRAFREVLGIEPPAGAVRGAFVEPYGVHLPDGTPYPEERMPYEQVLRVRSTVVLDDLVIHRRDGRRVPLRVFAKPIFDESGAVTHVLEAFTDITREIEAERARVESERKLARGTRLESIGQLVAGIAHDFNNILTVTKLSVERLLPGETDPSRHDALIDVRTVTDTAIALVRRLIGFVGNARQVLAPLEVGTVIVPVVELTQRTFEHRIAIRSDCAPEGAWINGDRAQLEQILMNLLVNARDAIAGEGQIVVTTRVRMLHAHEVETCPAGTYVVIEVADNGLGIDAAARDRVFEPYFTTKTMGPVKGTGLGLSTVLGNVRAHGGYVEARAALPHGTLIRIAIPSCAALANDATASSQLDSRPTPCGDGELILVVDDEQLVRQATARTLAGLGYRVIEAESGDHAISIFEERGSEIRGVVLDMIMPGLSARATYQALRERSGDVRVLLATGSAMRDEIDAIVTLGARGSLDKPFDRARVARAVDHLLRG